MKILLAHLNSNGDCIYATVIAKQIKEIDYPNCHLTWAINSKCKQSIIHNPHVDEIWEIPTLQSLTNDKEWDNFVVEAEKRKAKNEFDIIFYTQIIGKNVANFDGGIRSSIYNNYPNKITVSQQPIIKLNYTETDNVKAFAEQFQLKKYKHVFLIECGPDSFKSSLNPASAVQFAEEISQVQKDIIFILSSNKKIESKNACIVDGSVLTFRENAELTKYCTLFIGCSSGISWLSTTDWAKPLPKIIITNYNANFCSSMLYDHKYAGLDTSNIIEFQDNKSVLNEIQKCLLIVFEGSFAAAKSNHQTIGKITNYSFVYRLSRDGIKQLDFLLPMKIIKRSTKRNGFHFILFLYLIKAYIKLPFHLIKRGLVLLKNVK